MSKNKKSINILALFIGIILFVSLLGTVIYFGSTQNSIIGSTVLSLSQVNLQSTFAPLNGVKVWVYTFVQGGLGQFANGYVSANDANAKYTGTEAPKKDFSMNVVYTKQQCEYSTKLQDYGTPYFNGQVYSVKKVEWNRLFSCDTSATTIQNMCGSGWEPLLFYSETGLVGQCNEICGLRRTAQTGRLENPNINSFFTVDVNSPDSPAPVSFSTLGITKGTVGKYVYITWDGNFNTGMSCPSQSPYLPIFRNGNWQIISQPKYDTYKNLMNDLISNTKSDADYNFKSPQVNSASDGALVSQNLGVFENSASQTSAIWTLDIANQNLQRPVITAFVSVDWLGIVTPIGDTKIDAVSSPTFTASQGTIKVTLHNYGEQLDTVTVSGTCSDARFKIYENREVSVPAGQITDVYLPISVSVNTKTSVTCTIIATGIAHTYTKTFTATGNVPGLECSVAGQKVCYSDGNIKTCSADGTYSVSKVCSSGCTYDANGQPLCKEDVKSGTTPGVCGAWLKIAGVQLIPDLGCMFTNWFNKTILPYIIGFGIIASIIMTLLTYLIINILISKNKDLAKQKSTKIVILLLSLVLSIFYFTIFVWKWFIGLILIILLIIFLILLIVLKVVLL